jgi:hypothetical protein
MTAKRKRKPNQFPEYLAAMRRAGALRAKVLRAQQDLHTRPQPSMPKFNLPPIMEDEEPGNNTTPGHFRSPNSQKPA